MAARGRPGFIPEFPKGGNFFLAAMPVVGLVAVLSFGRSWPPGDATGSSPFFPTLVFFVTAIPTLGLVAMLSFGHKQQQR